MSKRQKGVYIDLDTLLDLRMSTIISNDPELGKQIIEDGSYTNRICDEFGYIGIDVYKVVEKFTNKNDILINAFLTDIFDFLMIHLSNLKNNSALNSSGFLLLTVNTYPYKLSEEKVNNFLTIFNTLLPMKNFYIDSIYKDPNDISLTEADSDYYSVFMYHGIKWLENRLLVDKKTTAPELNLFVPALLDKSLKLRTNEDYVKLFENLESASKMMIKLNFLEIKKYNLVI